MIVKKSNAKPRKKKILTEKDFSSRYQYEFYLEELKYRKMKAIMTENRIEYMRKYLETLLKEQHYPEISVRGILSTYDQIIENEATKTLLENVVHTYENSTFLRKEDIDGLVTEIAEKLTVHLFTVKLTCLLCMTKELARRLEEHGLDEQTIFLTIADFKFKSLETYDLYGIIGVSEWDWFFGFFQLERFVFGRLQFEIVKFERNYDKNGGKYDTGRKNQVRPEVLRTVPGATG